MSLKPQLSFSSGELDPILHDRVTLERFQNALATARNTTIGKSGTIKSRFGKEFFVEQYYPDTPIRVYSPPNSELFLEFGHDPAPTFPGQGQYIRLYSFDGTLLHEFDNATDGILFLEEDLPKLHFETSKDYVYVFKAYSEFAERFIVFKIKITEDYAILIGDDCFEFPQPPGSPSLVVTVGGTGYRVDYAFASVIVGEEVLSFDFTNAAYLKPISVGQLNVLTFTITTDTTLLDSITEVRIYSRPFEGSSFGFLGRTTNIYIDTGVIKAKFTDFGQDPDYANGIQSLASKDSISNLNNIGNHSIETGSVYQQRLILANFTDYDQEAIVASRPGFQNNFFRDFPISADSSLNFKAGTSGKAKVLRMIESDGLVAFTTAGVYVNQGVLNPDNLAMTRRGPWVIDVDIPPLVIPGGLFFVDKTTSTVRQLVYSQEIASYDSVEQSIFSDHLFREKTIKTWCFQEGSIPMIIVTFSDGTFATFTYSFEHQMRAWTRHDGVYPVEQVEGTGIADTSIFVINKNGTRQIEFTVPRTIPSSEFVSNPEAKLGKHSAFMDGLKIMSYLMNDGLLGVDEFVLVPVVADVWDGNLTLTCGTSNLFTNPGNGAVGTVLKFFHPVDKNKIELTVVSRANNNQIVVLPSEEFPEAYAEGFRLYETHNIIEGLDHLEGEEVAILCDGDVVSSPYNNNTEDTLTILTVIGGEVQIPEGYRSSISIVGRPIAADVKTLNISTVEQSPTTLESLTVNKLYVRVYDSRGIFVDNQFPEEKENEVNGTSVKDMQTLDEYYVPSVTPIIGNRAKPSTSKRIELTLPGEWDSNGQMAFRQVDPLHFEILSIIADVEILARGR